ncbi:odorant receptor 262 [Nasonia vitripennis]|uniref:Odorant receptor n=1 Tax=Nasonia vitripennis TaxID=7425 RepID=A0A7M6UP13_NASVI|nr:odorant receptor 262 [Nasonia vitripennis]
MMMELELLRYKAYTQNVIWFLKLAGLWPESHPVPKKILSTITLSSILVIVLTVSNFSFHNLGNIMVFTSGMCMAASSTSAFSKVALFLLHREDVVYLNKHLSGGFMRDMDEPDNRPDLLSNVKTFERFMVTHVISVAIAMFTYSVRPLLVLRKHGKYIRSFPAVYPFAYEPGGLVHWILYAVEVSGTASLWTVTIGVDCVFGVYALQVCGELRILSRKFRELRADDNYKEKLKDCIRRHHVLINAKNKLENIYGLISILLITSTTLVLCSLVFQVSELMKTNSYLRTAHLCVYLIPKFLQIFTYAWYGNLIAEESGACLDAMYGSHWTDSCDKNFKNDILIVLAQEPLALVAMGCMVLQLDLFAKTVKTAVSYFFLLRTMNEGSE